MFFFGKKKKKQPEKVPVWFMWLMGSFVIYALLTNLFSDTMPNKQKPQPENQIDEGAQINFAVVKGLSAGGPPLPLYARNIDDGHGDMAGCWYTVDVRYRLYNEKGEKVEERGEADEPLRFTIGKGEVIPALERGVMGMRKEGKREITARPELAFAQKGFSHPELSAKDFIGYVLTLEDMQRPENLPLSDLGLKIYDDKTGDGPVAQCTDKVRVKLRGYDVNGQTLFSDRDFPAMIMRLGEGVAPYAIERAAMGMKVGGRRTLIVPPGYMKMLFADQPDQVLEIEPEKSTGSNAESAISTAEAPEPEVEKKVPDEPQYTWQDLPVPQDRVIILELDLLPLQLQSQKQ